MVRTQIYLDDSQKGRLDRISRKEKHSLAELIRRAVDRYLDEHGRRSGDAAFQKAFGIWHDRKETGTAYVRRLRREWAR
jgi:metal-responsive CopG/Arc/MetJ family transcriptional regulator